MTVMISLLFCPCGDDGCVGSGQRQMMVVVQPDGTLVQTVQVQQQPHYIVAQPGVAVVNQPMQVQPQPVMVTNVTGAPPAYA
eukprot:TRINITY_DN3073_c0_g1_i1.p1 TRINITY_DN3073_c0_g1~~TRINITY_DN3073_c0_g1_i1.p1  ORF type:complete len:82 (+),score=6.37 TRINITY_DN3073_c0_g1_i1:53-298(+)